MIPQQRERHLVTDGGPSEKTSFAISEANQAHVMKILRSTLYSDKILAVVREYVANAWDAHRMSGKGDVPIKIHVPSGRDPEFRVRDYGPGISHEDIFGVFTQYGASTKRDTNSAVGMLGIGCKSAFAYSDSFVVVSWHGGVRRTYTAIIDETERGIMTLENSEPCGDETGLEIRVACRHGDFQTFATNVARLAAFMTPKPDANVDSHTLPDSVERGGARIFGPEQSNRGWTAVMGCVPYAIRLDKVFSGGLIPRHYPRFAGIISFEIGELAVSASREELEYTRETKRVISERIDAALSEFLRVELERIDNEAKTPWDRRVMTKALLDRGAPVEGGEWSMSSMILYGNSTRPKNFKIEDPYAYGRDKEDASVYVSAHARLVIVDKRVDTRAYDFGRHERIVRPVSLDKVSEARKELSGLLDSSGITGIPVVDISSLPRARAPRSRGSGILVDKSKYKQSVLVLKTNVSTHTHPWSEAWEAAEITPDDDDVYVVIRSFKPTDGGFFSSYKIMSGIASVAGVTMPKIYGYRDSDKARVDRSKILGTPYEEWREKFVTDLVDVPWIKESAQALGLFFCAANDYQVSRYFASSKSYGRVQLEFERILGGDHPATRFLTDIEAARAKIARISDAKFDLLNLVMRRSNFQAVGMARLSRITSMYPLFKKYSFLDHVGNAPAQWAEYVMLVDSATGASDAIAIAEDSEKGE